MTKNRIRELIVKHLKSDLKIESLCNLNIVSLRMNTHTYIYICVCIQINKIGIQNLITLILLQQITHYCVVEDIAKYITMHVVSRKHFFRIF